MPWTFNPPHADFNQNNPNLPKRVLLIGVEPNGDVAGPHNNDMGAWMWHAHEHQFWNRGGRRFFRAQLLHTQIARVAMSEQEPTATLQAEEWYNAGKDQKEELARGLMHRIRVVDLKSEAGGAVADFQSVRAWVLQHVDEVQALFNPMPDFVILQGGIVRRILWELRDQLIPNEVQAHAQWLALPHPSAQQAYPTGALAEASQKACFINSGELYYFSRIAWRQVAQAGAHANATPAQRQRNANANVNQPDDELIPQHATANFYTNLEALSQAVQECQRNGVNAELSHTKQWISCKVINGGRAHRVYLDYNGRVRFNRPPMNQANAHALCKSLPYLTAGEYSYHHEDRGGAGAQRSRHIYTPHHTGQEASEAWVKLFRDCLNLKIPGGVIPFG